MWKCLIAEGLAKRAATPNNSETPQLLELKSLSIQAFPRWRRSALYFLSDLLTNASRTLLNLLNWKSIWDPAKLPFEILPERH